MKRAILFLALCLVMISSASAYGEIFYNYSYRNSLAGVGEQATRDGGTAGEFKASTTTNLQYNISLFLKTQAGAGANGEDWTAELWSSGGSTPSALLRQSEVRALTTTASYAWYNFTFNATPLTSGTKYWINLRRSDYSFSGTNYIAMGLFQNDPSDSYDLAFREKPSDGGAWTGAGQDFTPTMIIYNATYTPPPNLNATVTAQNSYTAASLTNFTVTFNGNNYSTSNGTLILPVLTNTTQLWNLTYYSSESEGYFSRQYTDVNVSSSHTGSLWQAEITFYANNRITGATVSSFTANTTSNSGSDSNTATNPQLNITKGNDYQFQFSKNNYYYSYLTGINISALEQSNQTFSVYDYVLNVTINVIGGSATDQNFTANLYNDDIAYTETISTTNGYIEFNITAGNWTVYINDTIHELTNRSIELNASGNYTALDIDLYTTNAVSIEFRDENTGSLVTELITGFLTGQIESYNFTTTNGTYYDDLLAPDNYTLTYSAANYSQRTYSFTLTNRTSNELTVYMLRNSTLATVNVQDTFFNDLTGAIVYLQKKNLSGTNYYNVQSCTTDSTGTCLLQVELYDTTYRFRVYYLGQFTTFTSTGTTYSGDTQISSTEIELQVSLVDNTIETLSEEYAISTSLTYSNSTGTPTFTYTWSDNNNLDLTGCIQLQRRRAGIYVNVNNTCSTSNSGILTSTFDNTLGDEWIATGYVIIDGVRRDTNTLSVLVNDFAEGLGLNGLFIFGFIILLTAGFAGLWHPVVGPALIAGLLLALQFVGLISIGVAGIGGLIVAIVVAAYLMRT